nr:Unknown Function [uncultured bacterium]
MATTNTSLKSYVQQLEDQLDLYLGKKAPQLPESWRAAIVKIAPWITLILLILAAPALLALLGLGIALSPAAFMGGANAGFSYVVTILATVVVLVLEAMAIPGLMKREKRGWNLLYYSTLVSAVQNLLTLNIGSLIIGTLLSLYILFQIRSYYK